jgi:membrane protein
MDSALGQSTAPEKLTTPAVSWFGHCHPVAAGRFAANDTGYAGLNREGKGDITMTETHAGPPAEARSVTELVNDATEQIARLVRDEIQLAGLEMQSKGKRFGRGASLAGVGAVLAWYGGAALVAAAVLGLATPLDGWAAALIVGAVLLIAAAVLVFAGKKDVQKAVPPVPQEAVAGVQHDIEAIKDGRKR